MQSTQNTSGIKHSKPLIKPQETPDAIMTRIFKTYDYENENSYKGIIKHLETYQRAGDNRRWDEYAEKIPIEARNTWAQIISECARNGFMAPYVYNEKLIWRRVMTRGVMTDNLCMLCRRECKTREDIDTGEIKWRLKNVPGFEEPKKCWEITK